MRIEKSSLVRLALLGLLGLCAGCPGELKDQQAFEAYAATHPDAVAGTAAVGMGEAGASADVGGCGDVVARILVPTCGGTACHSAMAPQQGLDLASPGVAARVVGVSGKMCLQVLADPQNPAGSLIYQKLAPKPPCGAQMPLARPPLSDADAACVLAWIAAQ